MKKLFLLLLMSTPLSSFAQLKEGSFKADLGEATIAYQVHGQGEEPLMILTNTWGLRKDALRKMFRPLEAYFTVITFDPRGMGDSSLAEVPEDRSMATARKDMNALRQHLDLARINLLGWSNGAMNGLLYAAEHADHIDRAILMHGVAFIGPDDIAQIEANHGAFVKRRGQAMGAIMKMEDEAAKTGALRTYILDEWFPYLFADREKGRKLSRTFLGEEPFSWPHMYYSFTGDGQFDARPMLSKITCPTLIIAGQHDLLPASKVEELHKGIPNSQYRLFEKSGHFAMLEEPKRFLKEIATFTKGH